MWTPPPPQPTSPRIRGSGEGWASAFFPRAIPFIMLSTALHYNEPHSLLHIYITCMRLLPHASCSLHGLLCLPLRPQKAVKHTRPTEPAYLITLDARLALCAEKSAAEPLHPKPRTSLSTMAVSCSLQRLHLPLQQARWRRDRLLVHQLRLAAASWAARRRPAATVAQLERVASSRQHEGFCTREHAGEHGSGSASGHAGQGARGAPFEAA